MGTWSPSRLPHPPPLCRSRKQTVKRVQHQARQRGVAETAKSAERTETKEGKETESTESTERTETEKRKETKSTVSRPSRGRRRGWRPSRQTRESRASRERVASKRSRRNRLRSVSNAHRSSRRRHHQMFRHGVALAGRRQERVVERELHLTARFQNHKVVFQIRPGKFGREVHVDARD